MINAKAFGILKITKDKGFKFIPFMPRIVKG